MDNGGDRSVPDEPAEVSDLRTRADAVREMLATAVREGPGHGLRHLVGLHQLVAQLQRMEPAAERSAWVLQPVYF